MFDELDGCCDPRVLRRVRGLSLGLLNCTGRHTVSGMIEAGRDPQQDWSADYRVFSEDRFDVRAMFRVIQRHLLGFLPASTPLVLPLDDTKLRKTGTKIPGVSYQRDPMSPPFHTNLIRAQRFLQAALSVPLDGTPAGPARSFPVRFQHQPPPARPHAGATEQERAAYRRRQKLENLSVGATQLLAQARAEFDQLGARDRILMPVVDGSYTNRTVLRNLPDRTILIGRIRGDAKLFFPPESQPRRGRKRWYGQQAPTPDQLRVDPSVAWQQVQVWASGRLHTCSIKTIGPVLWKTAGYDRPLRVVVIRPLGYRLRNNSRLLYRKPAFLICTDLTLSLVELVQAYFRRWDIEVNHRDEKQIFGVGQAQVRNPRSVDSLPAFAVAVYSMMLVAAAECFGLASTTPPEPMPKWRTRDVLDQWRVPTGQYLRAIQAASVRRLRTFESPNFTDFETRIARHLKCPKSAITREMAIQYATS